MANSHFTFKEFTIFQEKAAFKVGTDGVLLGAVADAINRKYILDIGTGTGLITIMLAQRCEAEIVSIEPDYESFLQAEENVAKCKWRSRIKLINCDLQSFNPEERKFDLIVSNPPFFSDSLKNPDPRKSSARHNDSLSSADLLNGVAKLLNDGGIFQLIMPYVEGTIFIAEAQQYGLYCNKILKIKPLPTSDVRRLIMTFSRERLKLTEKILTIERGERHEFTDDYKALTKDFYLKF
ncbi:MAG: methyltransferase [Bacteroidales bacterium]|nr:methyltransferase [Bacteroidales bacterium]